VVRAIKRYGNPSPRAPTVEAGAAEVGEEAVTGAAGGDTTVLAAGDVPGVAATVGVAATLGTGCGLGAACGLGATGAVCAAGAAATGRALGAAWPAGGAAGLPTGALVAGALVATLGDCFVTWAGAGAGGAGLSAATEAETGDVTGLSVAAGESRSGA